MSKIRFIHTADLHLDSPFKGMENLPNALHEKIKESTFLSFTKIINVAIKEKVDFILIVGDIFDGENRSLMAQTRFRKELDRLRSSNIQVYISHGNHDHLGGNWIEIDWPENVHIFDNEKVTSKSFVKNGVALANIYGFSYPERAVHVNKTAEFTIENNMKYHIGMLHGNVDGNTEHDSYAPFKITELLSKDFSYWALGHIHKREVLVEKPPVIYPGNIQGRHRKELGEKGCYLVEMNGDKTDKTFIPTANILWHEINVEMNDINTFDELCQKCKDKVEATRSDSKGMLIHLNIVGQANLHTILQDKQVIEEVVSFLNEGEENKDNFLWVVSTKVATTQKWNRELLKEQQHFTGEIVKVIDGEDNFQEAIASLYTHRNAKKFLEKINEEKQKELNEKAENLLLTQLLRD